MCHWTVRIAACILAMAGWLTVQAGTIINVTAANPFGVVLALDAGTYEFQYIGKADGGQYDAWTAWSPGEICGIDSQGAVIPCPTGFINELRIEGIGPTPVFIGDHFNPIWATEAQALQSAKADHSPFSFTLTAPAQVRFLVGEDPLQGCVTGVTSLCWSDNSGGLSLMMPVPESDTLVLMSLGLAVLSLRARHRPGG